LQIKKYRKIENHFFVEGAKNVLELLNSDYDVDYVFATPSFVAENKSLAENFNLVEATESELISMGTFKTNNSALAVSRMKPNSPLIPNGEEYVLLLDDISDPGNFGTIIRTADWYGISKIICSQDSADLYSPKVLNASMGSFTRVSVWQTELSTFLRENSLPVYGAYLEGDDIGMVSFDQAGLILVGNESNGIRPELEVHVTRKVSIPRRGQAESLNVSVAAGIICDYAVR